MRNTIFLLALICFQLANSGTLVSVIPQTYVISVNKQKSVPVLDPTICGNAVNAHVLQKYSLYLYFAQLTYVSHIRYQGGFYFVHQYRDYSGTFAAVTRYLTSKTILVLSFSRLGSGFTNANDYYSSFHFKPTFLSLNLGPY